MLRDHSVHGEQTSLRRQAYELARPAKETYSVRNMFLARFRSLTALPLQTSTLSRALCVCLRQLHQRPNDSRTRSSENGKML